MKEVHENVKPELAKQITLWLAGKGLRKKNRIETSTAVDLLEAFNSSG
jgi:hypothetical protein